MAPDATRIQMLIDKVQEFLGGWLEQKLKAIYPKGYWQPAVLNALDDRQRKIVREDGSSCPQELDLPMQVSVFLYNWPSLLETFHLNRQLYNDAVAVKQIRNKYDHRKRNTAIDWERYHHDIETVYLFLKELKAGDDLLEEVRDVMSVAVPFRTSPHGTSLTTKAFTIKVDAVSKSPDVTSAPTPREVEVDASTAASVRPVAKADVTRAGFARHESGETTSSRDQLHVNECREYLDMSWDTFPQYFDGGSMVVSKINGDTSPVQGKGTWEYLVLLHCIAEHEEACRAINAFYPCPDTTPYVQGEYVVWQFPRYEETDQERDGVAEIYPVAVLPPMFDEFIASKPGTTYCPDCLRVAHNDKATLIDALWYLGNYFPRSFAETFCIFDHTLRYVLEQVRGRRDSLVICDVGVGAGGATLGLVWALRKYLAGLDSFKRIRIYGFDVNEHALGLFKEILPLLKREWLIDFDVVLKREVFSAEKIIPTDEIKEKVDFVITSKCLQEMARHPSMIDPIYRRFVEDARAILAPSGLVAIMEIARSARSSSLIKAIGTLGEELVSLIPNGEGVPIVGEERFGLNSGRIGRLVGEELLFTVIGSKTLKASFPEWVLASDPALNEQDQDAGCDESEVMREN